MTLELQAIVGASLSSFLGLAGGFLLLARYDGVRRWSSVLVSFAAGALLAAAFFDILPEAIHEYPTQVSEIFTWLIVGFLLFFLIEKFLLWHHHAHGDPQDEETAHERKGALIPLIIFGDAIHNFIDGLVIGAAFFVNPALGVTTAVAVLAHELPQEIGDFAILIHGGMKRGSVALWNILGALISPLGAISAILLVQTVENVQMPLLGLASGMFIYIAAADLIPEIHREKRLSGAVAQFALLVVGLFAITFVGSFFHG